MLRPIRSIATLATALLSLGLLVAGGPTLTVANTGRVGVVGGPVLDDAQTQTDEQPEVRRVLADVDPTAPIKPRVPVDKATVTGTHSLAARLGREAITTDRIFVKFRDDLKVRVTGNVAQPIRSDAPRTTVQGAGGKLTTSIDPNAALGDAIRLLQRYGGRVEQALPFTPAKLRSIELRAESIGRRQQPDLAGLMLVTVGNDPASAAEAFNALDAVEYAEIEAMPVPAQGPQLICNLVDQALQKGSGEEGANVRDCNEGTDSVTGNPALCTPGPVFPAWNAIPGAPWPSPPPTTGFGSIGSRPQGLRGSTVCNKPNNMAWWVPSNSPVNPAGDCDNPPAVEWNVDITNDLVYWDQHPLWDCTSSGCNSCSDGGIVWTGGGTPDCQYGCADGGCSDLVAQYVPYCNDGSGNSNIGWDALCATMANILCGSQGSVPYLYYSPPPVEPTPSQDNLTTYCYEWASVTAEPVPPTIQYHFQSVRKNTLYDPCFIARGPSVGFPGFYDGAVVFTDLGDLADISDRGIRPWGFLWEDPTNIPAFGFLRFEGASGIWDDPNCQLDSATRSGIGNKAIGGKVLAVDPTLPDNAIFAQIDTALKSYPYQVSHDCFTLGRYTPGCYLPTCCAYVCNIDPLCCVDGWDQACIAYARQAPDGYCNPASIGANWNTVACGTPDFTFKEVDVLGAPLARNLQLYTTARPVCLTTSQYITLANPTKGGPIDLSAINCQVASSDPDCGGGSSPVALDSTFGFLNSGFSGGGLDLAAMENWAVQLPDVTAASTRGAGITVGLIDYACNVDHEDLFGQVTVEPGQQIFTQPTGIIDPDHGAAVFGEILAADNGFGVTGIAPEAKGVFFPCVSINGRGRAAAAVLSAGDSLAVGDVLCIPLAFNNAPFWTSATYGSLLGTVADLGVTTFTAAGNGGADVTGASAASYVTVGACWPGRQVPLPVDDNMSIPALSYPGDAYCRSPQSNYSSDGSIAISGWGSGVCTLGYGTLFREPGNPNRNYIQNFSGTSAATGMLAGFAARLQAITKAYLGSPVSTLTMNNTLATNRFPQCSGIVTGTKSPNPWIVSFGDFVDSTATSIHPIGGFPKALETLQAMLLSDQFGTGIPYSIATITGQRLVGNAFSAARYDNNFYRVKGVRRGRGTTGVGYGRPLPYAGSSLITDIQVRATITPRQAERMTDFGVLAVGRVNIGGAGIQNTLAMCYVWNNQTRRWHYLTQGLLDAALPATAQVRESVIGRAISPTAVLVPEGDTNAAYVRFITYGLGIIGPYETWWDLIAVSTTSLPNP